METPNTSQVQSPHQSSALEETRGDTFSPGSNVIYGFHGKCQVVAIENRNVGSQSLSFYKLEIQKSPLSRSNRSEPAIWIPVATARDRGLRSPMTRQEADQVFEILSNREYYFPLNENWNAISIKIEEVTRREGAIGLAKALSCLHVLRKKQVVPSSELNKLYESMSKLLVRELAEAMSELPRTIEERATKAMRGKLSPDQ